VKNIRSASTKPGSSVLTDEFLIGVFARIDQVALGLAVGLVVGAFLLAATTILLLKGGPAVGKNLMLLNQYIPGYSVSWSGSIVGGVGGFVGGFVFGWSVAALRNLTVRIWIYLCAFWARLDRFMDDM
jgi:hypothetical protein